MKLNINQQVVLVASELNARQSVADLVARTGLSDHVVRSARDFLIKHELYRPYVAVSPAALGLIDFAVYIRQGMDSSDRQRFLEFIKNSDQVTWLAELGGAFQFCFSFLGAHIADVDEFLLTLSEQCPAAYQERCVAPRIRWSVFEHKFLNGTLKSREKMTFGAESPAVPLDELDKKVLREICKNPEHPVSQLARNLQIPGSTFQYRLENLISCRVIVGFPNYLNYAALGIRKYMMLIYEQGADRNFGVRFEAFCEGHPNVTTCLRALGEWTYEIDIEVPMASDLAEVRQEIVGDFSKNIRQTELLEYLTTHKMCPYPGFFG